MSDPPDSFKLQICLSWLVPKHLNDFSYTVYKNHHEMCDCKSQISGDRGYNRNLNGYKL